MNSSRDLSENDVIFNHSLQRSDFEKIAAAIVSVFKTECLETFFIPASKGKVAKGKLWDAYNHYRHNLATAGLITRRKKTSKGKLMLHYFLLFIRIYMIKFKILNSIFIFICFY